MTTPPHTALVTRLAIPSTPSLEHQARLAAWLGNVTPALEECAAKEDAVLAHLERLLGRNVDLVSHGPRASDVSTPMLQKSSLSPRG